MNVPGTEKIIINAVPTVGSKVYKLGVGVDSLKNNIENITNPSPNILKICEKSTDLGNDFSLK